jgi:hypothetical protein
MLLGAVRRRPERVQLLSYCRALKVSYLNSVSKVFTSLKHFQRSKSKAPPPYWRQRDISSPPNGGS